jgi:hypothetical protein
VRKYLETYREQQALQEENNICPHQKQSSQLPLAEQVHKYHKVYVENNLCPHQEQSSQLPLAEQVHKYHKVYVENNLCPHQKQSSQLPLAEQVHKYHKVYVENNLCPHRNSPRSFSEEQVYTYVIRKFIKRKKSIFTKISPHSFLKQSRSQLRSF